MTASARAGTREVLTIETSAAESSGTWQLLRWLAPLAARRWRWVAVVFVAMMTEAGLTVLSPWPLKILIDNALGGRAIEIGWLAAIPAIRSAAPARLVLWCVVATVVLFTLSWAAGLASAYAQTVLGQRIGFDLAARLYDHLQRLSLRFHVTRAVGDTIRRVTDDCATVATTVRDAMLPAVTSALSLIVMFAVMWRLHHGLTVLALAALPCMLWVMRRYESPLATKAYAKQNREGDAYAVVEETLGAVPLVQAFAREADEERRFRAANDATLGATLDLTHIQLRLKFGLWTIGAVGTAAVLFIGGQAALVGAVTVGTILVFMTYLSALFDPLESLVYTSSTLQEAGASARRVQELLMALPEVVERPGARTLPAKRGAARITLERVTAGYTPGRPVLHDISLTLEPGEIVALVGATGAGKSTIAALVPRLLDPWAGRVLVDGEDVRECTLASVRGQVAVVLQEAVLWPRSVAENIAYGRPTASRGEIEAAAEAAGAAGFIGDLPEGYDTVLGARGATLSGGERQRLAVARALVQGARVIVLDEATSALDGETESVVLAGVERLAADRTVLLIAHRWSVARRADRVVVLDQGRIVEVGAPEALLRKGGRFTELFASQATRVV
jgi:ATP-binding cassette, subfamily B, bacterial